MATTRPFDPSPRRWPRRYSMDLVNLTNSRSSRGPVVAQTSRRCRPATGEARLDAPRILCLKARIVVLGRRRRRRRRCLPCRGSWVRIPSALPKAPGIGGDFASWGSGTFRGQALEFGASAFRAKRPCARARPSWRRGRFQKRSRMIDARCPPRVGVASLGHHIGDISAGGE